MNRFAIFLLAGAAFISAVAKDIECRPGELAVLLGADAATETSLRITGSMDAADFRFIDTKMPALRSLDLGDATIVAYQGSKINGLENYPANTIPAYALAGKAFTSIILPSAPGLNIGEFAFASSSLKAIELPSNVTAIGVAAFSACKNLASVKLNGQVAIPASCFADCTALTGVEGAENLTEIGDKAFAGTVSLSGFTFGPALRTIGAEAFYGSGLAKADMSGASSLKTIGPWAFAKDSKLATVAFSPATVTIGEGAFFDCAEITQLIIPEGVTSLPAYVFKGSGASNVTLPSKTAGIGDHAMHGMTNLGQIDASNLADVPELGKDVWEGVNQADVELKVLIGTEDAFRTADQWREFNIRSVQTGSICPEIMPETALRARFAGMLLEIEATGADITTVEIYGTAGNLLLSVPVKGAKATIDTTSIASTLMIVRCLLDNGSLANIKLIRRNG